MLRTMIKKTISQNWQILEKISSGAFGDIYKIQNRKTGKFAALKIFKPEFQNRKILIKTNFAAASEISHKNCLKMIEWIETDGQFGFIMELIVGKPITILKVRSSPEIINSFINICNGLDAIHSKSFIHRDLKPSNILINKNGDVKITDFDFLKTGKNLLAKDEYLGSIRYSSPEQCIDPKAVDQRSDLYSLGIILFEIFTGKVPFDGRSWEEIATKQVKSGFIVPKKIKKLIPESLVSIIQKLLQKKSEDRYQNARELAIALQSCLLDKNSEIIDAESNFLLSPRFINREDQLQKLEKIFRESQNNISRSILISGEKGSGKSRLIKHFIDSISVDHLIFKSKADRTQNQSIKSILGKIIKADEQESKTDQEEILKDNITALSAIFPNLKKSPFYQQNGNSNTSQNEIITAIFETIRAFQIASDKPMILVFEDFQFADDLSSKWISKAIGKSMKLFLIVSYNSNEIKGTFIEQTKQFPPERTEKIVLENFDLKNTFLQINSMLGNSGNLKPSTLKKIYSLTNGNPLFIEELLKFFLKEDFLKQKNGSWKFNEDAFSAIPENISILLNHELTKLSANSLEIMRFVSLFGEKFSLEILTSVLDQKTISKCLEEALALNIIEQNEDTGDFSFCKSFTQKSLEESLTKGKKKEIYRKIADFLEAEYLSEKLIEVEQLADFYYQAEVPEKAIKYLDPAIRSCIRKFSFSKAIAYLLKLISLLKKQKSSEKTLIEYYIKLGKLQRNDDMKNAEESFQNALQLAEKVDDPELMIESNANLGWLNVIRGHLEKSLFYYEKRAKLAEKIDDISIKARAYAGLANIYNRINRYDESIENNKKYIALSEKIGRKDNICVALQNIGSAYYHKNEPENALAYLNKSWKIAQEIDHLTTLTNVCCVYGLIYTETGEFDKALQYYSDNIKFALKNHKKRSLSIAYGNMGNT
ncbi:MAG: protein kinase, partial [Candidatus Cloacimonetes bacterium]|nr:protein kinase [Candidatus Cloacimonadota bacterium]